MMTQQEREAFDRILDELQRGMEALKNFECAHILGFARACVLSDIEEDRKKQKNTEGEL